MIYFLIAIVTFTYLAYHVCLITRNDNTQTRVDLSRVTHYDHVNATFNRHGRAIVRDTSRHVI